MKKYKQEYIYKWKSTSKSTYINEKVQARVHIEMKKYKQEYIYKWKSTSKLNNLGKKYKYI